MTELEKLAAAVKGLKQPADEVKKLYENLRKKQQVGWKEQAQPPKKLGT